jgi:hypothetical protein
MFSRETGARARLGEGDVQESVVFFTDDEQR